MKLKTANWLALRKGQTIYIKARVLKLDKENARVLIDDPELHQGPLLLDCTGRNILVRGKE